ncbi:MAG: hypothetical protein O8C58_02390 [Candidatus Methanoperedens sp.]|nr:hypothetical protein [Candidatus Methanoperedens sp.]
MTIFNLKKIAMITINSGEMAESSGMFWCISCKKTFLKKDAIECPNCGSKKIKPRAK